MAESEVPTCRLQQAFKCFAQWPVNFAQKGNEERQENWAGTPADIA